MRPNVCDHLEDKLVQLALHGLLDRAWYSVSASMTGGRAGGDPAREAALHTATAALRDAQRLQQVLDALAGARIVLLPRADAGSRFGSGESEVAEATDALPSSLPLPEGDGAGCAVSIADANTEDDVDSGFPSRRYGAFVDELFRTTVPRWGGALSAGWRKRLVDDLVMKVGGWLGDVMRRQPLWMCAHIRCMFVETVGFTTRVLAWPRPAASCNCCSRTHSATSPMFILRFLPIQKHYLLNESESVLLF